MTKVHGFLWLLRTNIPFVWEKHVQDAFDTLKKDLNSAPLLSPLNFTTEFILYVSTFENSIASVLIQEDNSRQEHVIYYVS